jgi:hypothetical protein
MVLHLAEELEVPLRDRNHLLLASATRRPLRNASSTHRRWGPVRDAIDQVLRGHEPYGCPGVASFRS